MGISLNELKKLGITAKDLDVKTIEYVLLALKSMSYYRIDEISYLSKCRVFDYLRTLRNNTRYRKNKDEKRK